MIEINLNTAKFRLTVEGHAMAEETKEHSEICAAVSAMAQALAYTITRYEKDHESIKGMDYRSEPGDFLLQIQPEDWAESFIRKRMQTYGDGLELLAGSHPESIHMIRDGEEVIAFKEGDFSE